MLIYKIIHDKDAHHAARGDAEFPDSSLVTERHQTMLGIKPQTGLAFFHPAITSQSVCAKAKKQ